MSKKRSVQRTFLMSAAAGALAFGGTAHAQDADEDDITVIVEEEDDDDARMREVTVTGSLLRRSEYTSTAPIQVITADIATSEGLIDTGDIIRGQSAASGATQLNSTFNGFIVDGGTGAETIDLRGLGAARSLVVLNGLRPGPSGTRGAVGSFDLSILPALAVTRIEILSGGASAAYGSDAVAGVVNIITRDEVDRPLLDFRVNAPLEGGGEEFILGGAYGLNFDFGSIALSGEYFKREPLRVGDRDYLACDEDYAFSRITGERIDVTNTSPFQGPGEFACRNLFINSFQLFPGGRFGGTFVPSPDGTTQPGVPVTGYELGVGTTYSGDGLTAPIGTSVENFARFNEKLLSEMARNEGERISLYGKGSFDFGAVTNVTEAFYSNRKTVSEGWRQFFPFIGGADTLFGGYSQDPGFQNGLGALARPIILFPSNTEIDIDYGYARTTFTGDFGTGTGFLNDWVWDVSANYSYSSGDYTRNQIPLSTSGDFFDGPGIAPAFDYFDPAVLSGDFTDAQLDILSVDDTGNTVYTAAQFVALVNGPLFEVPAGEVLSAFGVEYRTQEIEDTPGPLSASGDIWGSSSSLPTNGENSVAEVFAEFEVPLLRGAPFAEELTFNAGVRGFEYDIGGSDFVYKLGLDWQINPSIRIRGTSSTAYRAPQLFEIFQGETTGFNAQVDIDPCIFIGNVQGFDPNDSATFDLVDPRLLRNCQAAGIPLDYQGAGSSATIASIGGGDSLENETGESQTIGVVFSPTFADLSLTVDYLEITVENQVAQLGAGTILGGCYVGENFPNSFCDLIQRNAPNAAIDANSIRRVSNQYINVNEQTYRAIDMNARYEREFGFGEFLSTHQATWTLERVTQLFDPGEIEGFNQTDQVGQIGFPSVTANGRFALTRGDFEYNVFYNFVGNTSNERFNPFGDDNDIYRGALARGKYTAEATTYWDASIRYLSDDYEITLGVANIFDEHPPAVSADANATRRGTTPIFATQYDLLGRRGFGRLVYRF